MRFTYLLATAALLGLAACSDKKDDTPAPAGNAYALFGATGTGASVQSLILETNSLTEGTVSAVGQGTDITASNFSRLTTVQKDGIFYNIDGTAGKLGKYRLTNGRLETIKEVPFSALTKFNWYQWTDANTLLLTLDGASDYQHFDYAIIDAQNLTVTKSGRLPVPAPRGADVMFIGTHQVRDGKLYLYYSHFDNVTYASRDTARVAVINYPAMTLAAPVSKDVRSTYPGCGCGNTPGAFTDESGDQYVITGPGAWLGARPDVPTGILRVKAGATAYDPTYFFNTRTASGGENQQGLWYLGNGKALVKTAGPNWDYSGDASFAYAVVDVRAQTLTKLNMPRTNANFLGEVLVEGSKARIALDTDQYIYTYDSATGSITKGAKVNGLNSVELLLRVN